MPIVLKQEMYKLILQHLIELESKGTTQDYWGHVKTSQKSSSSGQR